MNPRIALIGAGKWGSNLARVLAELNVLSVVCDKHLERQKEISALYGVEGTVEYQDILSNPSIDGVVIATPAFSHATLARQALLKGKDVLVEKPMALNVQDGEELAALARAKGCILMVGHVVHYHPAIEALKKLIENNELGAIRYIQSHRLNFGQIRPSESILWSFAPHDVSLMISFLGMPQNVLSTSAAWRPDGTPDMTMSHFSFAGGAGAHVYVSWLHPYKEQRLTVIGENGMAVFDGVAGTLTVYPHHLAFVGEAPAPVGQRIELSSEEPLKRECSAFLRSIQSRMQPFTNAEEGLNVLRVLEACQRSQQSNQTEPIIHTIPVVLYA